MGASGQLGRLKRRQSIQTDDLGKTEEKTVNVVDGKITLEAESEVPYVVCKGRKRKYQSDME